LSPRNYIIQVSCNDRAEFFLIWGGKNPQWINYTQIVFSSYGKNELSFVRWGKTQGTENSGRKGEGKVCISHSSSRISPCSLLSNY
jgi:hypothetical protein